MPAERFPFLVKMLDMTFAQVRNEHPDIIFRSDNTGKDMYRALIGKSGQTQGFVVPYLAQGQIYTYTCKLKYD